MSLTLVFYIVSKIYNLPLFPISNEYGGDTGEIEGCGEDDVADEVGGVSNVEGDPTTFSGDDDKTVGSYACFPCIYLYQ